MISLLIQTESNSGDKDDWGWDEPVTTTTTTTNITNDTQKQQQHKQTNKFDQQQHDGNKNENEHERNKSDGSFDFDDFNNFDDQAWGYDDNDSNTTKDEKTNFENENSDYTSGVAELVARKNQENSETTLLKQASNINNKAPVKGGMSLKSKTAVKKQAPDEKLTTTTEKIKNNKADNSGFITSASIKDKTNKLGRGGGLLAPTTSNKSPKPKPAIKDDLGDEFSIKIKTKPSGGLSTEPDFFADMVPSLNDTSKIAKTVLIERKDDSLSSKFNVTASAVDTNMVSLFFILNCGLVFPLQYLLSNIFPLKILLIFYSAKESLNFFKFLQSYRI